MLPFIGGHGEDDGLGALEGVIRDIHILEGLSHARQHAGQVLDIAHLLHLLDLLVEVPEGELVFGQFLLELAGLFLVKLLLGLFYQGNHVSHAQDTVCNALRVEHIQGLQLFSGAHELDGLAHHGLDGKGRTAAGVAVHLGKHHAVKVQPLVEGLGRLHGILARHGIHHKERLRGLDGPVQGRYLVHQLLVHGQAAGGIHNHHAEAFGLGLGDGALGNFHRVFLSFDGENRYVDAFSQQLELLDGGRTESVAGGQKNLHAPLGLDVEGQLGAKGGFTGTVEARHQHNAGVTLDIDVLGGGTHEGGQLVVGNLHHHLLGLHGCEHTGAYSLVLHLVAEVLGHLVTYVGVQQGLADVLDGFRHVNLGNLSFSLQDFKRPLQSLAQILKHILQLL